MKYPSDYTEQGITALLNKYGGFFAFSDEQFDRQKKEGVQYVNCGAGLVCPAENAKLLIGGIVENGNKAVQQDLAENGRENIIRRELANHEAYYTGDIEDTCDALGVYGITPAEVRDVYCKTLKSETI